MKILIVILVTTSIVLGQIDLSISTDNHEYSDTDTIFISLQLSNLGNQSFSPHFDNECETAFFIGDWFSLDDTSISCQTNYHNVTIEPNESVEWNWVYVIEDHPGNIGRVALNGVLFIGMEPLFTDLMFIEIGEVDSTQLFSGFMPSVDTLLIVGGCVIPELIIEPDTSLGEYQKLILKDNDNGYSIDLRPRPNWNNYMNSTFFWFSHDSIPFTFTVTLETNWDTTDIPIGEGFWLDDGLLKIFIHDGGAIVDSITQLIDLHVTGAVFDNRQLKSNLIKAFPNPFNPDINLSFELLERASTRISIYNIRGEEVYFSNLGTLNPAVHHFEWQGVDNQNKPAISGVYLIQVSSNRMIMTKKVTLLK